MLYAGEPIYYKYKAFPVPIASGLTILCIAPKPSDWVLIEYNHSLWISLIDKAVAAHAPGRTIGVIMADSKLLLKDAEANKQYLGFLQAVEPADYATWGSAVAKDLHAV
jgi:hypothetical protein